MSRLLLSAAFLCIACTSYAHHPDRRNRPVRPRIDVLGPIGARLPLSHRRKYNRPTNLGGYLAYLTAPSSQEAMAWHKAKHRGNYEKDIGRTEMQYFYPKPWEVLNIHAGVNQSTPQPGATQPTMPGTPPGETMPSRYAPLRTMEDLPGPPIETPAPLPAPQTPATQGPATPAPAFPTPELPAPELPAPLPTGAGKGIDTSHLPQSVIDVLGQQF